MTTIEITYNAPHVPQLDIPPELSKEEQALRLLQLMADVYAENGAPTSVWRHYHEATRILFLSPSGLIQVESAA